jgi:hypothetical protein
MQLEPLQAIMVKRVVCKEVLEFHNPSNSSPEYLARVRHMMLLFNNSIRVQLRVQDSPIISRIQMELQAEAKLLHKVNRVRSKAMQMDKTSTISILKEKFPLTE